MESTISQLLILCASVFSGVIAGVLYEPFYLLRRLIKFRTVKIFLDVLFFLFFSAIFISVSVVFDFPEIRLFTIFGAFAGFLLYIFSLHRIVAFLIEKLYNVFKLLIQNFKKSVKNTNGRRKN